MCRIPFLDDLTEWHIRILYQYVEYQNIRLTLIPYPYTGTPPLTRFPNNTLKFGILIFQFSTKSRLWQHGFLFTLWFFHCLKKPRKWITASTCFCHTTLQLRLARSLNNLCSTGTFLPKIVGGGHSCQKTFLGPTSLLSALILLSIFHVSFMDQFIIY